MAKYFEITGIWVDDNSEFTGVVKSTHDVDEQEDDKIFYYGLSESDLEKGKVTPIDGFLILTFTEIE